LEVTRSNLLADKRELMNYFGAAMSVVILVLLFAAAMSNGSFQKRIIARLDVLGNKWPCSATI
jgi:hypothetical protein